MNLRALVKFQVHLDNLLLLARVGRHSHRCPHLHQQSLEEVGEPEALGIRILNGHERCLRIDHRALLIGVVWMRLARLVVLVKALVGVAGVNLPERGASGVGRV